MVSSLDLFADLRSRADDAQGDHAVAVEPAARFRVNRPQAAVLWSPRQTVQPADRLHGCYPLERRKTGQPISVRHDAGGAPSRGPTR
jgi:hypothetical protein